MRFLLIGLLASAMPASAQVRFDDFGFSAGVVNGGTAQLTAATTLRLDAHAVELLVGSVAQDAFTSALRVWQHSRVRFGAGLALHSRSRSVHPALGGMLAYALPLAPRGAAALQVVSRASLMRSDAHVSLGLGVTLAPRRGGILFGENMAPRVVETEATRSWDAVVAQVMLLDNGASSLHDVMVTGTSLVMRFRPMRRAELVEDIGRVARVLSGSVDPIYLTISAPEPAFIAAAATAGGFPAERIVTGAKTGTITLQATRTVAASARHFEQSSLRQ